MLLWAVWLYGRRETGSLPYSTGPEGPRTHLCPRTKSCCDSAGKQWEYCIGVFPKRENKERSKGRDELILMTLDCNHSDLHDINVENAYKSRNAGKSSVLRIINTFWEIGYWWNLDTYPVEMMEAKGHSCQDDSQGTVASPSVTWGTCRDTHTNTTSPSISPTLGKAVVGLLVDAIFNLTWTKQNCGLQKNTISNGLILKQVEFLCNSLIKSFLYESFA